MFTLQLTPTTERSCTMPQAKELGKSFRVLELSLSCQLRQLAQALLDMETDQEKEANALLAVRISAGRFTAFTADEIMWYLCEHMRRIEYEGLEQELCNYAQASQETIHSLNQSVHVLMTDLSKAQKDALYWRNEAELRASANPGKVAPMAALHVGNSLIRDTTSTKIAYKNGAKKERVTKKKREGGA